MYIQIKSIQKALWLRDRMFVGMREREKVLRLKGVAQVSIREGIGRLLKHDIE